MRANSPQNATNNVLGAISEGEVKNFLMDSVNLPWSVTFPDHRASFERWLKRWQRLFTFQVEDDEVGGKWHKVSVPREQLELFAPIVRTTLCRLWVEQDARQRDWYCYRLRDVHRQMVRHLEGWQESAIWGGDDTPKRLLDYALQDVPRICPFEAAIFWLQLNHTLMLRCAGPLCEAPYFFRTEKRQKYCSPECADPARKQAKLKWWNENRKHQGNKKSLR